MTKTGFVGASKSVLVVGGGHNGLVCASYLARAGYRVDILEARSAMGGGAASSDFAEGYRVSGLAHILHSLSPQVRSDLQLDAAGLETGDSIDTIALDKAGQHITLGIDTLAGGDLSADDIEAYGRFKREFIGYAKALEPLMMNKPPRLKDMDRRDKLTLAKLGWQLRFGLGKDSMREFLRIGGINIYDVLNEVFDSPLLKGAIALDAVMGQHMGPRTPNTVLTYLHRLWGETHSRPSLPSGGMGSIAKALERAAANAGVSMRTAAKVQRILVVDGAAVGVELESGEQLHADIVISNADAKTTFLKLVDSSEFDAMFVHRVNSIRANGDVAKVHLALDGLPKIVGLSVEQLSQRLIIAPNMRYVEHAFNHSKYAEFSENPLLEITIPSIADSSLAPPGHHVMSISASFAPYALKLGWETQRDAFMQRVIAVIEQYAPGFGAQIIAREILTPVDIETQYHLSGGHWHHGEMAIDQLFMLRPVYGAAQYDTPIEGLYLCGAAAHPGGGLTGLPGRNAAQRVMRATEWRP
ncbi:MAG: NAD(P)/FAD-dependent oxidoreductase [Porticoccaceae bacterium]|nr:NAD(P)/FAD-dependent oxidoreductase [Porticoccaceae bacterium]